MGEAWTHGRGRLAGAAALGLAVLLTLLAIAASVAIYPEATGSVTFESGGATLDASNADEGYVMVKMQSEKALKVRITGLNQYTYDLDGDGEYDVYPLQDGDGTYTVVVYEQVEGTSYAQVLSQSVEAAMADANAPFLAPNRYSWYTRDSAVVSLSDELLGGLGSDREKAEAAYEYVVSNMTYDYMKAVMAVGGQISGYVPDLDEVLETKTGICFDFAALMCALLRAQGVPTQMVMGYADTTYHAWNNVYLDGEWTRFDATAAVTHADIKQYTEEAVY